MKTLKRIARMLTAFAMVLVMLEGLLRAFDPLGLIYFVNLNRLAAHLEASPSRGYVLEPGRYDLFKWSATELPGYTRRIPDNPGGVCTVVLIGDSVTWGEGVDDAQTWANLLARQLSNVNLINAAYNGYNSENVRGALADFPRAQAFIYLVISNDPEPTLHINGPSIVPDTSALSLYWLYLTRKNAVDVINETRDWSRFYRDIDAMGADPRVTLVAFDAPFGQELQQKYPVKLIPMYTHWISRADGHPNTQGNQEIAVAMLSMVRQAMEERCAL